MKSEQIYRQPPRTAMEVFNLLPEGTLCEVVENQLYRSPAPNRKHQDISMTISTAIYNFIKSSQAGKVYSAPIDVFIEPNKNALQPDIVFVSNENASILSDRGIEGAPDLVIEILSKGNAEQDTIKKKVVYERCGVKELWYVDPMKGHAYGFILEKGKYRSVSKPSKIISLHMMELKINLSKEL